jgi:hypothetical protein
LKIRSKGFAPSEGSSPTTILEGGHARSRARSRYLRMAAPRAPHSATRAHLPFLAVKELAPHGFPFYQSPVSHPRYPQELRTRTPNPPGARYARLQTAGARTHPWLRSGKSGDLVNLDTQAILEHLPVVRFPAEKDQVADIAEQNDAPGSWLRRSGTLTPNASTALTRSYRRCKGARALALCPPELSDPETATCPSVREGRRQAWIGMSLSGASRWRALSSPRSQGTRSASSGTTRTRSAV